MVYLVSLLAIAVTTLATLPGKNLRSFINNTANLLYVFVHGDLSPDSILTNWKVHASITVYNVSFTYDAT